ncbi:MAG: hypothetical protein ACF8XB_06720, partial [Planctomycetota bacterium JB042]
ARSAASEDGDDGPPDLRILRLFRLLRLEAEGREAAPPPPPDLIERDGEMYVVEGGRTVKAAVGGGALGTVKGEALAARVGANLRRIVRRVRDAGAAPVLLTYATENQPIFRTLNANARAVAAALDVPLVALDEALRGPVAEHGYRALFFPDDHPTARGNERVAEAVAARLERLGLVRPARGSAPPAAASAPAALSVVAADEAAVEFSIEGAPDRDFQVVLSPLEGPPVEFAGVRAPLGAHPLVARSLESQNLRGRTDATGAARCRLSRAFVAEHRGETLFAVVAIFPPVVGPDSPPTVSDRVSIRP